MKEGTGSNPFESDTEESDDEIGDVESKISSPVQTGSEIGSKAATAESEEIPYVLRRSAVKEGRTQVGFPLQDSTITLEKEIQREVEDRIEADIYQSDLREAAYIVGLQHADEVADLLSEWGYEYR